MALFDLKYNMNLISRCGAIPLCVESIRPKCTVVISSVGMDSQQAKKKDRVDGIGDGRESNIMDIFHGCWDDIYDTTNSVALIEKLLEFPPDLQNLKERDEGPRTGFEKNRGDYGILEQNMKQFHMGIPNLKEDYEIPQNLTIGELGQRMNSREHTSSFVTMGDTDLESQIDSKFMQKESSESTDAFQKMVIKIEAELPNEIRKGQEFQRAIEDLQKMFVSLGQFDSMQEQITILQQELQAKTELAEIQQK